MINFKVRFKNPVFIVQIILAVFTPLLAYANMSFEDINSWGALGALLLDAFKNPYILSIVAVSVFNAVNDPTTVGITDSKQALSYTVPKEKEE
ncbi:MAG: phage holin family protein [Oscillospiraceae bacterium]|nr:phage holin family protein [Oscillospiraceae bacterium]